MLKDNLKKARMNAGLTQKETAKQLGVVQQQYARWEQGQRNPKIEVLDKLADIFNTTTDALKGRDDGLEDIITILRQYDPNEEEKADIQALVVSYFKDRR